MREINAGLLTAEPTDEPPEPRAVGRRSRPARRPRRRRRHRRLQGLRAAAAVHRVRPPASGSCRPPRRCASSARRPGRRCPASRSPPTSGTTSTRCRTCALGQHADLVVVAPATADLLAKAAHGLADDLLTNTLLTARCPVRVRARRCTPRCGSTRPPRPTSRTLRAPRRHRDRARRRPAHRRRHRQGPAARPGGDLRGRAAACCAAAAAAPTWPAGTWWSPPAAPASRSTRCASSATAPPASRGTRSPAPRSPAGARVTLIAANVALPDPAGVDLVRVGTTEELRKATLEAAAERRRRW